MKNPFGKHIAREISAWFLFLAIVPMSIGAAVSHINTRNSIIRELSHHLRDIIRERIERIELYVTERRDNVITLAATPAVIRALENCERQFCAKGMEPERLAEVAGEAHDFLLNIRDRFNYYDIFLINRKGDVVYSLVLEDDLGTNLRRGPYRASGLARAFNRSIVSLDSEISPFFYYPPSDKVASFIAAPVFSDNGLIGVLAIQLNEDGLFGIINDYVGLGDSGELIAAYRDSNNAIIAAAPLRHRPNAFIERFDLSQYPSQTIRQAVSGRSGFGLASDYRGEEVLAAWDFLPSLGWGLVVKVDRREAFAPVFRHDFIALILLFIVLVLVLSGVYYATKSIADPIKHLTESVRRFTSGEFNARAEINVDNEVAVLADIFNEMAMEIEEYSSSLEMLVAHRTAELKHTADNLDRAQAIAHIGSWEWHLGNNRFACSAELYRIFGMEPGQSVIMYETLIQMTHPGDRWPLDNAIRQLVENDLPLSLDHRIVRLDGTLRFVHEQGVIIRDETGGPVSILATMQDVTEIRAARRTLQQYVDIIDKNVITSSTDLDGDITYVSDAFCRISGYEREELIGQNHRLVRHPDMPDVFFKGLWQTITAGKVWHGEIKNLDKNGKSYWVWVTISPTLDDNGEIVGYTSIQNDITNKKKIEKISITDELTRLYNRRYFNEFFPRELQRAKRNNAMFAFLMLDVDYFKKYNDTYGHPQGDEVLRKVGVVLRQQLKRSEDFAFRLGGEEFGAIITQHRQGEAAAIAARLLKAIERLRIRHEKNATGPYVTASCGFISLRLDKDSKMGLEEFYRGADSALYRAKQAGRNRVEAYPESI